MLRQDAHFRPFRHPPPGGTASAGQGNGRALDVMGADGPVVSSGAPGRTAPPRPVRRTRDGRALEILDQTALPQMEVWRELATVEEVEEAIRNLRVRGAPLLGVVAAWAIAMLAARDLDAEPGLPPETLAARVGLRCARLVGTRPTAINLGWALTRMEQTTRRFLATPPEAASALAKALESEAASIESEDQESCRLIGEHALPLLSPGARLLTHCNAGALATAGIGTALAPVYLARERGWALKVFVGETRPLLQGSRLTAWELTRAGVDVTLLTDDMAGALFARERPTAVLVGADRIAANGDVANKVGTYTLAVLASHHRVPFYVLAPTSTVDLDCPTGEAIPIEMRGPEEVRRGFGALTAPEEAAIWNPAFDVTPGDLVAGIVTEKGVARAPFAGPLRAMVEEAVRARARASDPCPSDGAPSQGRQGGAEP